MRLSALRKLVEQAAAGGGGNLNFAQKVSKGALSFPAGAITPVVNTVANVVYLVGNVADGGAIGVDISETTVVYSDTPGSLVASFEVPPGQTYSIYRKSGDTTSTVDDIIEVPRNA